MIVHTVPHNPNLVDILQYMLIQLLFLALLNVWLLQIIKHPLAKTFKNN